MQLSPVAFNATKCGILHSGSAVRGITDSRIAEAWFWLGVPSTSDRAIVRDTRPPTLVQQRDGRTNCHVFKDLHHVYFDSVSQIPILELASGR